MVWAWLRSWWRGRDGRRLGHWQVVLYTRRGCHSCARAWAQLDEARQSYGFALSQVDVDGEPELARQYGDCVPVVTVNGRVRFRGALNPVLLRRLLRAGE
jgi:glutaredoxin